MACHNPLKFGLPSAVRGALYFVAASGAAAAACDRGDFCTNAGDAMIPCMITTRIAVMTMCLMEARIQILHLNRVPAHHCFGLAGSAVVVPLFQQVRKR